MVADVLPESVYARILEYNPFKTNPGREWATAKTMRRLRQPTPYDHRRQINFETDEYDASDGVKRFWADLSGAFLADDWIARAAYEAYPAYFDVRFGEAVLEPQFFRRLQRRLFVQRHEPGFSLGPHTDSPHRVFTCIFSFASETGFERYGTQFLRPKDPDVRCSGDLHHNYEDFDVVAEAPYAPNSLVLFFKTRQSFHCVPYIEPGIPNDRFGMQIGYYEPPTGVFKDLSRPDLMEKRVAKPIFSLRRFGRTLELRRG